MSASEGRWRAELALRRWDPRARLAGNVDAQLRRGVRGRCGCIGRFADRRRWRGGASSGMEGRGRLGVGRRLVGARLSVCEKALVRWFVDARACARALSRAHRHLLVLGEDPRGDRAAADWEDSASTIRIVFLVILLLLLIIIIRLADGRGGVVVGGAGADSLVHVRQRPALERVDVGGVGLVGVGRLALWRRPLLAHNGKVVARLVGRQRVRDPAAVERHAVDGDDDVVLLEQAVVRRGRVGQDAHDHLQR
eukprot:2001813-Pleurochrysis_carterae.AAC.4